jgi:subtilisin family serine protease
MKLRLWLLVGLYLVGFCSLVSAEYAPGKIIVKFKPGIVDLPKGLRIAAAESAKVKSASIKALNKKLGLKRIKKLYKKVLDRRPEWKYLDNKFVLYFPKDKDLLEIAKEFKKDPSVVSAYPVGRVKAFSTTPNDPYFTGGQQYGLINISAPQAWDRTTGSSSTLVAVLDTGVNYQHEDLQGRIDLEKAYDFVNNDSDPMDDHYSSHGTGVVGVIAAATNNNIGIAGLNWQAKILPVKVLDGHGNGDIDFICEGIMYAVDKGADVINMSFGHYFIDQELMEACENAYNAGVVLVAAAGNDGISAFAYPANYSGVMSVASVDQNDQRSIWNSTKSSNYGSWIDVCAPGTDILTTSMSDEYAFENGTSFACPYVSGLASLVKGVYPGLSPQEVIDLIKLRSDNIDTLNPGFEGQLGKRINAYLVLGGVVANIAFPQDGDFVKGRVNFLGSASGWDFISYVLEAIQNETLLATLETSTLAVENASLGSWDTSALNGEYDVLLKVFTATSGNAEERIRIIIDNITPEAQLSFPFDGATLEGEVAIRGTAFDQYFEKYVLEYANADFPVNYERIAESAEPVKNGLLSTWQTAGLNGEYIIRLTAYDRVGSSAIKTERVNISNSSPDKKVVAQGQLPATYAVPNPFDREEVSEVTINYWLTGNFNTRIYIFDALARLVWFENYSAGENGGKAGANNPSWDGQDMRGLNVANGVYLYQVVAGQKAIARGKIIVLN